MDRRFSTALALSLLFMMGYMWFRRPEPVPAPVDGVDDVAQEGTGQDGGGADGVGSGPAGVDPGGTGGATVAPVTPPSTATQAELQDEIWVETDFYKALLTNQGGTIRALYSKEYEPRVLSDDERETLPVEDRMYAFFVDMDPTHRALSLELNARGAQLSNVPWEVNVDGDVEGGTDVTFKYDDGDGTIYEKILRFRDGAHHIEMSLIVSGTSGRSGTQQLLLTAASNATDDYPVRFVQRPAAVVAVGDDYELWKESGSDLDDDGSESVTVGKERLQWFGSHTNHFAVVLRPDDVTATYISTVEMEAVVDGVALARKLVAAEESGEALSVGAKEELLDEIERNARSVAILNVPRGERTELTFDLYAGPKSPIVMDDERYEAFETLYTDQYGSFGFVNSGLLSTLRFFHSLTSNWGVAIILLTVLVKILLFPMMRLQSRSMEDFQKKMQKLKPKLDSLKEKYKGNAQKFQQEQQKLMREHQVRPPVLGCLVIVLQFPVFIGLFQILQRSFEIRHQPFFGWIGDLSQPDALFALSSPIDLWLVEIAGLNLLPLLMMAAMVLQFKSMPKPKDEQQAQVQKMMMIMPFAFGFFLYNYPSGLSLYMLVNALLGIVQTKYFRMHTPT